MAFEMNIEADRIGDSDFNLLSSFVKLPLMILGGVLGRSGSNVDEDGVVDGALPPRPRRTNRNDDDEDNANTIDCSDLAKPLEDIHAMTAEAASADSSSPSPSSRIVSHNDIETDNHSDSDGLKRSKKMSWSDSAGLKLVEYDDETLPHDPKVAPSKPAKSAMKAALKKRTRSERDPAAANSKRFIPKIAGAGMTMPSFSNSGSPALSAGYTSPEWGWYVNTTPPTPEMYHSSSSFSTSKLTRSDPVGAPNFPFSTANATSTATGIASRTGPKRHKNTVFQNLQSNVKPNMGWTSVPI